MQKSIIISGNRGAIETVSVNNEIECKGRNGLFVLSEIFITRDDKHAFISFYSSRSGKAAPSLLYGNLEDLKNLFEKIVKKLS